MVSIYQTFLDSTGVSTDSRTVQKGNLFFALSGENFNGNKFANQALEKGALCAIIDDVKFSSQHTILVEDVLVSLQQLAKHHREQLNLPIIALTGSNGKTTTKELINAVLSTSYNTIATVGNLNNHIGVPLTLLRMDNNTEIGIVEMGANHPKEIELLSNIACPNFGYITNFGKAHLEGFGSLEGVIKAKSELYSYLREHNQIAFVNSDNAIQLKQSEGIDQITFSEKNTSTIQVQFEGASPNVTSFFKNKLINSNLIGAYNFTNIAAAITIGAHFKVECKDIKFAIENYLPTNNRSQIIDKNSNQIILDAYNANPSSMMAALENFSQLTASNKIVFLGDMFELGATTMEEHQVIVDFLEISGFIKIFIIGEAFSKTNHSKKIQSFISFEDFKMSNTSTNFNDSTLLIKGSRGMALERLLDLF